METEVWAVTRRSLAHHVNEDRAVVGADVLAATEEVAHRRLTTPATLAVVDGVGGHAAGDVASDLAAQVLATTEVPDDEAAAADLLRIADRTVNDAVQADPSRRGMGATVVVLALNDHSAVVANAGDATAWKLVDGRLELLATSDRVGRSGILQCLGVQRGVSPHVRTVAVQPGDRLLLASDGLTDVVPIGVVSRFLQEDVAGAARNLLALVEEARLPDDVTIVVAEVTTTA
jgi:PPM family protein phosphatase